MIGIVVLNYNGWRDTVECLESILRNRYPAFRIVVVDNASTDGSLEHLADWAAGRQTYSPAGDSPLKHLTMPSVDKPIPHILYLREEAEQGGNPAIEEGLRVNHRIPPVILVRNNENAGYGGGNNLGIRYLAARGGCAYVWILNNDTVVEPAALNALLAAAEAHRLATQRSCLVGATILDYRNPDRIQAYGGGRLINVLGISRNVLAGHQRNATLSDYGPAHIDYVCGTSIFIDTDSLNVLGPIPEEYFMYWEDVDWSRRALRKGFDLIVAAGSLVYHKEGASSGVKSYRQQRLDFVGSLQFYRRYGRRYLLPVLLFKPWVNLISAFRRGLSPLESVRASIAAIATFLGGGHP